ncbi:MAG: hypothetical protein KGZ69_00755 [Methylomonas sp.]|nr:hypothetical protein [Methylomonas sp.]
MDEQLKTTLRNIHNSLKWLWQIVMGLSLAAAGKAYAESLVNLQSGIELHFLLVLFVLTFFRYLIGNARYLDERYVEFIYDIDGMEEGPEKEKFIKERTSKLSGRRQLFDYAVLTVTGIMFLLLGNLVTNPNKFTNVYLFLYFINIAFLVISVVWNTYIEKNKDSLAMALVFKSYSYEKYPVIWIINNSAFLALYYLLLEYFPINLAFYFFVIIFIANSLVDIYFVWEMYFPKLSIEKHRTK